jgi:L-aminopeptidase/D-esterase-like protein
MQHLPSTWRDLITDVPGIRVGHFHDTRIASGTTALIFDEPAVAAMDVRGGGPGTREGALLDPANTVERIDAIALSGGSAFGLDAAGGLQSWLIEQGRGLNIRGALIPIVPGAIIFDLLNGGDKNWGRFSPYREWGYEAASYASHDFALGTAGAGYGATTATLKGGIGSASGVTPDGVRIGALAVVNAAGSVTLGDGPHFWAAPFEQNGEFGGRGFPAQIEADMLIPHTKGRRAASEVENTTLAIVATDAGLTKIQAKRLAVMAQTGFARAIYPVHAPLDGDVLFAASVGTKPVEPLVGLTELGALAANVVARAVARGVYEARALAFTDAQPSWQDRFGR